MKRMLEGLGVVVALLIGVFILDAILDAVGSKIPKMGPILWALFQIAIVFVTLFAVVLISRWMNRETGSQRIRKYNVVLAEIARIEGALAEASRLNSSEKEIQGLQRQLAVWQDQRTALETKD